MKPIKRQKMWVSATLNFARALELLTDFAISIHYWTYFYILVIVQFVHTSAVFDVKYSVLLCMPSCIAVFA